MVQVMLQGRETLVLKNILSEFTGLKAKMTKAWQRHLVYRQVVFELSGYSDRELEDLGIARYDIERLARESSLLNVDN